MREHGEPGFWLRRVRRAQVAAVVATVALVLALAQQPVRGAFSGSTSSTGSQVSTATTFCATPSNATVTAEADSFIDQANGLAVSGGTATYLVVTPQAGAVRRTLVRFPMPPVPNRCTVTSATLRIFAESQTTGRTLGAYRADPTGTPWTEAGLSWSNQPAMIGTAATAVMPNTDQYVQWSVTALVRDIYSAGNNGFVVRDQDETGPGAWQQFSSRSVPGSEPQLYVAWG